MMAYNILNCFQQENSHGARLNATTLENIQGTFSSVCVSDENTLATIRNVFLEDSFPLCPHSAIGVFGARTLSVRRSSPGEWAAPNPLVAVLTAHASKFSETFKDATGRTAPTCWWSDVEELRVMDQRFEWLYKEEGDETWQSTWVSTLKASVASRSVAK